jgi:hypothetical protein
VNLSSTSGRYADRTGSNRCTACTEGKKTTDPRSACVPCAIGEFQSSLNATACDKCEFVRPLLLPASHSCFWQALLARPRARLVLLSARCARRARGPLRAPRPVSHVRRLWLHSALNSPSHRRPDRILLWNRRGVVHAMRCRYTICRQFLPAHALLTAGASSCLCRLVQRRAWQLQLRIVHLRSIRCQLQPWLPGLVRQL